MEQGVDLQRLQQFRKRPAKARRKLNRTYGGEITVPTPRTSTEIKEALKVCYMTLFNGGNLKNLNFVDLNKPISNN